MRLWCRRLWHSIFGHARFGWIDKDEGRVNYRICGQCLTAYDIAEDDHE